MVESDEDPPEIEFNVESFRLDHTFVAENESVLCTKEGSARVKWFVRNFKSEEGSEHGEPGDFEQLVKDLMAKGGQYLTEEILRAFLEGDGEWLDV